LFHGSLHTCTKKLLHKNFMLLMQSCDNTKAKGAADLCHCTHGKKPRGSRGACPDNARTLHLTYFLLHYTLRPPPSFRRHRHRHQRPYHPWHHLSCPRLPSHRPPPSSCSSQPRSNLSISLQKHQLQLCRQ